MKLDVENVMTRVRAELAMRSGSLSMAEFAAGAGPGAGWTGALPPLPHKSEYVLSELLAYSDRAFVENAYNVVLRRPPDPEGLRTYLDKLRNGSLTKVEVLAALRWSEEGVTRGVHVDGLLLPFLLQKWRRKRFIGPVVGWLHALVRLPQLAARPAQVEAAQARETAELTAYLNAMLARLDGQRVDAENEIAELRSALEQHADQLRNALEQQADQLRETDARAQQLRAALDALDEVARRQGHRLEEIGHHVTAHGTVLAEQAQARQARIDAERALDPMYVAFEERFRGSPELIRARMEPYLALLREANVGGPDQPILDLGCGNGDWLALLRDHGFHARGIDTNETFVELCRGRGLDVTAADALETLRALPDGSVGGITAIHIVEHLAFEDLVALLDECRRVLCLGGLLALETPNPENLLVASLYFYMDPTHRNPLPPETLRWLVEARGYEMVRVERWTVARDLQAPPLLAEDVPGSASINPLLATLHVAPDYAVIARRL